ncbi:MAG: hypothetical protein P4L40_14530 [Terracidiphilus sp.]|nr:hypothetical protein [Terracidiphilus sp.]
MHACVRVCACVCAVGLLFCCGGTAGTVSGVAGARHGTSPIMCVCVCVCVCMLCDVPSSSSPAPSPLAQRLAVTPLCEGKDLPPCVEQVKASKGGFAAVIRLAEVCVCGVCSCVCVCNVRENVCVFCGRAVESEREERVRECACLRRSLCCSP